MGRIKIVVSPSHSFFILLCLFLSQWSLFTAATQSPQVTPSWSMEKAKLLYHFSTTEMKGAQERQARETVFPITIPEKMRTLQTNPFLSQYSIPPQAQVRIQNQVHSPQSVPRLVQSRVVNKPSLVHSNGNVAMSPMRSLLNSMSKPLLGLQRPQRFRFQTKLPAPDLVPHYQGHLTGGFREVQLVPQSPQPQLQPQPQLPQPKPQRTNFPAAPAPVLQTESAKLQKPRDTFDFPEQLAQSLVSSILRPPSSDPNRPLPAFEVTAYEYPSPASSAQNNVVTEGPFIPINNPVPYASGSYGPPPVPLESTNKPLPPSNTYLPPALHKSTESTSPTAAFQASATYLPPKTETVTSTFSPRKVETVSNPYLPPRKEMIEKAYLPPNPTATTTVKPKNEGKVSYNFTDVTEASSEKEVRFVIHKPGDEEIIKNALIEDSRITHDSVSFLQGPNLKLQRKQKVYLPPKRKTIVYVLLKEPQVETDVEVIESEESPKPEVYVIYENARNDVRMRHYDLTKDVKGKGLRIPLGGYIDSKSFTKSRDAISSISSLRSAKHYSTFDIKDSNLQNHNLDASGSETKGVTVTPPPICLSYLNAKTPK